MVLKTKLSEMNFMAQSITGSQIVEQILISESVLTV
jgi:hypothetical protein